MYEQSRVKGSALLQRQSINGGYVLPRAIDVKCGQGGMHFEHPGNQRLRTLIEPEIESYHACTKRGQKQFVVQEVVKIMYYSEGVRFLKYNGRAKQWYDGGLKTAKTRVRNALKNAVLLKKKNSAALLYRSSDTKEGGSAVADKCTNRVNCDEEGDVVPKRSFDGCVNSEGDGVCAAPTEAQHLNGTNQLLPPSCNSVPWWLSSRSMLELWTSPTPQQPHVIFVQPTRKQGVSTMNTCRDF